MKKLIPAICMLLVAASLLGTSTYAWFSMNDTVTASSMQIKATTDANLYIAKGASVAVDAITGIAVTDLSVNVDAVKPAEMIADAGTVTVKDVDTYETDPEVDSAGVAKTFTDIGTITNTAKTNADGKNLDNYVAVGYVSIARKQTAAGTYTLTPTCTVTCDGASELNKALRVGIVINNQFIEAADANSDGASAITFTFNAISGLNDNTAYSAALLMWFEGADSDCFVNNAATLSGNTAEWSFQSANA